MSHASRGLKFLYRRFFSEHRDGPRVTYEALEIPDMSVNRTFDGRSKDVAALLFQEPLHEGMGVFGFLVMDIPTPRFVDGVKYGIRPIHVRLSKNYLHSEIRIFRNDSVHLPKKERDQLPTWLYMKWQFILARKTFIEIEPRTG